MTRFWAAAVVATGLVLAGCGVPAEPGAGGPTTPSGSTSSDPPALQDQVQGRSFETSDPADVTGFDLVEGSALTLSFYLDPDGTPSFGGNAGCNSMGGAATWDGETVRAAGGLAQTEMACEGLMEQEAWWANLLTTGITVALDGDQLTVSTDAVTITMVDAAVLHPDLPLQGTTWRLNGLIEGAGDDGVAMSAPIDITASMTISPDPDGHLRLDVFNGLTWLSVPAGFDATTGQYDGSVTIEPSIDDADPSEATVGTVRITGGLGGNSIGCPPENPDCFIAEMGILGADFAFETDRDTLTVTGLGDNAGHGLMFIADPTAPAPDLPAKDASDPADSDPADLDPADGVSNPADKVPAGDNPLLDRTFELTGTFTDDGGADRKDPDAVLRLTFHADTVSADGSCGEFTYQHVSYVVDPSTPEGSITVDLGQPDRAGCVIGEDPSGPPQGRLWASADGNDLSLSTGFVAWNFRAVD